MCSLSANLGDTRTIVTHPASTTHSKLSDEERNEVGITAGLVRCSVGLENVEDIIADLRQALDYLIWAALSAFRSRFFASASLRQKELRSSRAAKDSAL